MRKGARLEGRVKETELLINSVTENKPKMLIGLSQKASGWIAHPPWSYRDIQPSEERQSLTPSYYLGGTR